jgi:hypothetical protein
MSHLTGQTLLLKDITMDTFVHSSFGTVVITLFQGLFTDIEQVQTAKKSFTFR